MRDQGGHPAWDWFQESFGVLPPQEDIEKFTVNYSWFQETFRELPHDADEETVMRYVRAWGGFLLSSNDKAPRVLQLRHRLDMLRESDAICVGALQCTRRGWLGRFASLTKLRCGRRMMVRHLVRIRLLIHLKSMWTSMSQPQLFTTCTSRWGNPSVCILWCRSIGSTASCPIAAHAGAPARGATASIAGASRGRGRCFTCSSCP
ncbi:hypothetical protein PIB30_093030 [Stylosanthes scabra]|uniref:Uncharacterized protein n=1 Tax=Stylosanthes scabra TaxID=79078 RepID=A0ABU6WYE2_9FABA|nr:hypothetical protein [Stylosanthes scabra]